MNDWRGLLKLVVLPKKALRGTDLGPPLCHISSLPITPDLLLFFTTYASSPITNVDAYKNWTIVSYSS